MAKKKVSNICPFRYDGEHHDCYALRIDGKCHCLQDTDFKDKNKCPFYKQPGDVDPKYVQEVRKINNRILASKGSEF